MALKIVNLSKKIGDKWILRDASLEVGRGEIFGLLGTSGAGKSTFLRIIGGAEKPDSGKVFFDETDLTESSAAERAFNFLQNKNQSGWKSIFKSGKTDSGSTGENQILQFECEIEKAERVLLLDNPFCCASETLREAATLNLRRKVREKNPAVILVTNDYAEAFGACDRVGVLHKGEIVQTGAPRELYEQPSNSAVAAALGRCNFIEAMRVSFNNQKAQEFQTLAGNHRLQTDKTGKRHLNAINSAMILAIRPEHISISFGASFPEDNLLKAKIFSVEYQGATTRVKLESNGLILEALVLRLVGLNVGDECLVGLPPSRILVLKD